MAGGAQQRRLAAVLIADIAGYTSRVEKDTDGTVAAWQLARATVIEPSIKTAMGRIVKWTGDGFLAEFKSVRDAVECALSLQALLHDNPLDFRMAVNMGDIIDDGQDIHGEGVNIAARIEALAAPGGIAISGGVYDQVRHQLDCHFDDLGSHRVKHVSAPIQVYAVSPAGSVPLRASGHKPRRQWVLSAVAAALLVVAIGGVGWWGLQRGERNFYLADVSIVQKAGQPSIAVLPFANLSDDTKQGYFADGVTEDLTTDLSKVSGLYVSSSSATLKYRKNTSGPRLIGETLKVGHVLEGSVRRVGKKIRITAKLIDVKTEQQLWAERYDREIENIFEIQDEIADQVIAQLAKALDIDALQRQERKYTPDVEAYDLYIRARAKRIPPTKENLTTALEMFEKAIAVDPLFAGGYAGASYVYTLRYDIAPQSTAAAAKILTQARMLATEAVKRDPSFGPGWSSLAEVQLRQNQFDDALASIQRAIKEAPNDSLMRANYGRFLGYTGQPVEGIEYLKQAMRMSPDSLPLLYFLGGNYRVAGDYQTAIETLVEHRKRLGGRVVPAPTVQLAAAYVQAGEMDKGREEIRKILRVVPHLSREIIARSHVYKSPEAMRPYMDALAAAGLP